MWLELGHKEALELDHKKQAFFSLIPPLNLPIVTAGSAHDLAQF